MLCSRMVTSSPIVKVMLGPSKKTSRVMLTRHDAHDEHA
jgi:hypothetical protein